MKYLAMVLCLSFCALGCGDDDVADAMVDLSVEPEDLGIQDAEQPDLSVDVAVDISLDMAADATTDDAALDAMIDATPDATVDATIDATPDAMVDATVDAMVDATVDADVGTFLERLCRGRAAFAQRCGQPAIDVAQCQDNSFWCAVETMLVPSNQDAFIQCHRDRACAAPETDCATAAVLQVTPTANSAAYRSACEQKRSMCNSPDELTCSWDIFTDSAQQLLNDCLGLDCTKVGQCTQSRFAAVTCGQQP